MAYNDGGVIFRGDLQTMVEEARNAENLLIGLKVFPAYGVPLRQGRYPRWPIAKGKLLNRVSTLRAPGGEYGEITRSFVQDTYDCIDRGLEERVDDANRADQARFFDAEAVAAKRIDLNFRLDHEVRVAAQVFNTTNFTANNSGTAYTEANLASFDVPADINGALERLDAKGATANTLIMSNVVLNRIKRSTRLQNFVRGNLPSGQPVQLTAAMVLTAFQEYGITQLLVGRASYNASKVPSTYTASQIWSNAYIMVANVQGGDPMSGGIGRTFAWDGDGGILVAESYRDNKRRSDIVRVRQETDEQFIDGTAGELVTTQYS